MNQMWNISRVIAKRLKMSSLTFAKTFSPSLISISSLTLPQGKLPSSTTRCDNKNTLLSCTIIICKWNSIWSEICRKGDYYRYLAEFKTEQERKEAAEQSLKGYEVSNMFFFSNTSRLGELWSDASVLIRLQHKLQALSFLRPIRFVLALLLTSLFSTTRSWTLLKGLNLKHQ